MKFFCVCFLFLSLSACVSTDTHLGLIHSAIEALHNDGNTSLRGLNPHFTLVLLEKSNRLPQCFNSQIGFEEDEEVDLFNAPLKEIIYKYMKSANLVEGRSLKEIAQRVHNLVENLQSLAKHVIDCVDAKEDVGTTKVGLTKFSHLSKEEFEMAFKGSLVPDDDDESSSDKDHQQALEHSLDIPDDCQVKKEFAKGQKLPESFDYRDQNVVSPIKNQGYCGSCWLFASLASIESAFMLKYKEADEAFSADSPSKLEATKLLSNKSFPISFSEMYTMDCLTKDHYKNPCEGGQPKKVFAASMKRGTVLSESAEPYVPYTNSTLLPESNPNRCKNDSVPIITRTEGYCRAQISERNDDLLQRLLLSNGPMTAAFRTPQNFKEDGPIAKVWAHLAGPLNTPCNSTLAADHLMLLVGWTPDYWILKNSYGIKNANSNHWGVEGYVYLNRSLAPGCGLFGNGESRKVGGDGYFTGEFTFPFVKL